MENRHSSAVAISSTCPECGGSLRIRRRRRDGGRFLGCGRWPRCDFAQDYDAREQELAARVLEAEAEVARMARGRRGLAAPVSLDRKLRELVFFAHPDRHDGNPLAGEFTARLNALRDEIREVA